MGRICVVGSANLDIVTPVPHHPVAGETVLGGDHAQVPGGKGANQAVAAARLGHEVAFVGRVGDDGPADVLRASLSDAGVELSMLTTTPGVPSGIATISVGPDGDNSIVVSPGANSRVSPGDINRAGEVLRDAAVVLVQLEVPFDAVGAAAELANGVVVLNPAPAPPGGTLPADLLAAVDVLVPNQTELALLAGGAEPANADDALALAASLPVDRIVVTLGAEGALVIDGDEVTAVPAPSVVPVDTTAAGDAFCGALGGALADGASLADAAAWAVRVGSAATLRAGAQPSLPLRNEVDDLLQAGAT